jgi:hypothetical protein
VEAFWAAWYSMAKPSQLFASWDWNKRAGIAQLVPVSAVCMFKDGIQPEWEDPANASGGQWHCQPTLDAYRPGPPGAISTLSVFLCKSVFYGAFCMARRALTIEKRRFPARAVLDKAWELLALALISGASFGAADGVCVGNIRLSPQGGGGGGAKKK